MIPPEAVEAAAKAFIEHGTLVPALEAAAPHMQVVELAAEYRRGYRDGLADRKQVAEEPRAWEPGDPVE